MKKNYFRLELSLPSNHLGSVTTKDHRHHSQNSESAQTILAHKGPTLDRTSKNDHTDE